MTNPYTAPTTPPLNTQIPSHPADLNIPGLENAVYPLKVSFKILAFAPQIQITDATGRSLVYVKQKLFKFKEHVEIFTDKQKTTQLGSIKANKVIDWSARYFFSDTQGNDLGSVGRKGMRSLWKASYQTFDTAADTPLFQITEENPAAKIFDSLLGEIPLLGFATSFLFHPRYGAIDPVTNETVMRLTKKPALFEGKFELTKHAELSPKQQLQLLLSFLMLILLERSRG